METKMRKVKITTIILAIILVTLVAFAGVYIKIQNRMENKVKDYSFGRELEGGRVVELKVVTEEGTEIGENETTETAEKLTLENYEIVKKTVEKRLNNLGAQDYTISLNKEDGTIRVELEENDNTDIYVYYLTADGKVQITESENGTELLNDSMVEKATYTYTSNAEGQYKVIMELTLTEEGQTKIEEIKNTYAVLTDEIEEIEANQETETTEETTEGENTSTEETIAEETKKIAKLTIAGNEYDIEKIEKNKITVAIGSETKNTTYVNNYISVAAEAAMLINSGKYPVEYEIEDNRLVYTDITEEQMLYFAILLLVILFVTFIVITVKYKAKGLFTSISYIGFVSILSLILRYTNVTISIEGIGAIIVVLILNIRINQIMLEKSKVNSNIDEVLVNTYKEVFSKLVPILIVILVFCFAGVSNLSSFGMVMFWGLVLIAVYNAIVTKALLKLKENK